MDLFGFGNKIVIENGQNGFAKVTVDGKSLFVNCLGQWQGVNYTDTVKVSESIGRLMDFIKDKIEFEELEKHLIKDFGKSKVFGEGWV